MPATSLVKPLPPELHSKLLGALDERLIAILVSGGIRLVRSSWLLTQPNDFKMLFRQQLEALDDTSLSPLLPPKEAAALVRRGDRSVGALSHGWLSPGSPDPAGMRVEVLRKALVQLPNIVAIFFDFASLYQHPPDGGHRTTVEDASFKRGERPPPNVARWAAPRAHNRVTRAQRLAEGGLLADI